MERLKQNCKLHLELIVLIQKCIRAKICSGGTNRAHWEDVTENTPLTFVNDCVSFTTTVSARYWLIDCRHVEDATKMATELYRYKHVLKLNKKLFQFITFTHVSARSR